MVQDPDSIHFPTSLTLLGQDRVFRTRRVSEPVLEACLAIVHSDIFRVSVDHWDVTLSAQATCFLAQVLIRATLALVQPEVLCLEGHAGAQEEHIIQLRTAVPMVHLYA